jgi:hypothetical protein
MHSHNKNIITEGCEIVSDVLKEFRRGPARFVFSYYFLSFNRILFAAHGCRQKILALYLYALLFLRLKFTTISTLAGHDVMVLRRAKGKDCYFSMMLSSDNVNICEGSHNIEAEAGQTSQAPEVGEPRLDSTPRRRLQIRRRSTAWPGPSRSAI